VQNSIYILAKNHFGVQILIVTISVISLFAIITWIFLIKNWCAIWCAKTGAIFFKMKNFEKQQKMSKVLNSTHLGKYSVLKNIKKR